MNAEMNGDTSEINLVLECNGNDEAMLTYEERRLEIELYVQALEIAQRCRVDISAVSIRFVQTTARSHGDRRHRS